MGFSTLPVAYRRLRVPGKRARVVAASTAA